jgi:hypothetical protein
MAFDPQVIAELRVRAAQLDLSAAKLDVNHPGEPQATKGRRYREVKRTQTLSAEYRRLIELAEADGEG